ncbi:cob(I)alamin adenosyltransferase [Clostridia bacterium]|nr:cob(I)alamin adenosyltransferase [Clostridia bacterium]
MFHLYYGEGKGKTTAAMGMALRALGHCHKLLIAQFMKDGRTGELQALRGTSAIIFDSTCLDKFTFQMDQDELAEASRLIAADIERLIALIDKEKPQTIILDELAIATHLGLVTECAAHRLITAALQHGETIVTGRNAPVSFIERADYVSEVVSRRHPFDDKSLPAREGVEW